MSRGDHVRLTLRLLGVEVIDLTLTDTDPDEWHGDVKTELVGFSQVETGE